MRKFRVQDYLRDSDFAAGAGLGATHFDKMRSQVQSSPPSEPETVLQLDFGSVELATPSYIKSFLLTLYYCARLECGDLTYAEVSTSALDLVPLPIFPVVTNASGEVEETIDEVFARRKLPILSSTCEGKDFSGKARLLGELDAALLETLKCCCELEETTATELSERYPRAELKPTGWSNRLDRLYRLRLLARRKSGRNLIYSSIAKEVTYGAVLSGK